MLCQVLHLTPTKDSHSEFISGLKSHLENPDDFFVILCRSPNRSQGTIKKVKINPYSNTKSRCPLSGILLLVALLTTTYTIQENRKAGITS